MATLGATVPTLADWAKRLDPNGKIDFIVENLEQSNEILQDMPWVMGNLPTGHRTTIRTGLPTPAWRLFNQGVQPTKSTTAQIEEGIGMLHAWAEVDVDLAKLNDNIGAFRLSEARPHMEAMGQEVAGTLIYGNSTTAPEEFTGLAPRYSSLSADIADNIVAGGGSGSDNTSIWLVQWGENTIHGIFPKGSQAGLMHEDLGVETVEVTAGVTGTRMRAYRDHFQWKVGLAVRDWRHAVRICNIDISELTGGTAADLTDLMTEAIYRLPYRTGSARFYMNRTVMKELDLQRRADVTSGGGLTFVNVDGEMSGNFRGIPLRIVDQITETEATVA